MNRSSTRLFILTGVLFTGVLLTGIPFTGDLFSNAAFAEARDLDTVSGEDSELDRYRLGLEVKTHYRDSDQSRFGTPAIILGEQIFLETVDAGSHFEVSVITVEGLAQWRDNLAAKVKIDFIDRYDRNPTSEDREIDVDEAWLRYGHESQPADVPDQRSWYAKLGKFGKFERQDDRRLESYGLVSTSFNRLEDVGLEVGLDITPNIYVKGSFSQGNPLFFRDPNVLAGDNGTSVFNIDFANPPALSPPVGYQIGIAHPLRRRCGYHRLRASRNWFRPRLAMEFPIGFRRRRRARLGVMNANSPKRPISPTLSMAATLIYSKAPETRLRCPSTVTRKSNLAPICGFTWAISSLFAQYVDQDLAGLNRIGFEFEVAWAFDLPIGATLGNRQLFPWLTPVLRYSKLDPKFGRGDFLFPSVVWDWEKIDFGLRFAIIDEVDITVEWQDHTFVRLGKEESNDEFLITLTLDLQRGWP